MIVSDGTDASYVGLAQHNTGIGRQELSRLANEVSSMDPMRPLVGFSLLVCLSVAAAGAEAPRFSVHGVGAAAQAYGRRVPVAEPPPDGPLIVEAEEFRPLNSAWRARDYGTNFYVSTFANTFLSRYAYLSADVNSEGVAERQVRIPKAGEYLVLVRYEAAYRFNTEFAVEIEQEGRVVFRRSYGSRDNPRIWPFGMKIAKDVAWPWGANEQIVWEGHDAVAPLKVGLATIRLVAQRQSEPAARRNVDCLLLTTDREDVEDRINRERYLPLDGLLTQAGDLVCRVSNLGASPLRVTLRPCIEHSPYWVHLRRWKAVTFTLDAGGTSEWIPVGGLLDTLNHSVWQPQFSSGDGKVRYRFELALSGQQDDELVVVYDTESESDTLRLYMSPAFRYVPLVKPTKAALPELLKYLEERAARERIPEHRLEHVPVYALTFSPEKDNAEYESMRERWLNLFPLSPTDLSRPATPEHPRGYIDVRHIPTSRLEEYCRQLKAQGLADRILVVSLGDEISLPAPGAEADEAFRTWLRERSIRPQDVVETARSYEDIVFSRNVRPEHGTRLYYYTHRFAHEYGIEEVAKRTEILRRHLPHALIGANYSPHHGYHYLGEVHKWVEVFRRQAMTLPWSEDYIWQVPVVSPQVNSLGLDLFRAGLRETPGKPILYYVMPHWPGNTPSMWRRLFFASLGHGMKIANLFEFRPLPVAYTENYVNNPETYWVVLKTLRELASFDDIIWKGSVVAGTVGLWFSEVADIWRDYEPPFAAEKRALYVLLHHLQLSVEVVTEADVSAQRLGQYRLLFLTDTHISREAAKALLHWVRRGGHLIVSPGAGSRDEFDKPIDLLYVNPVDVPKLTRDRGSAIRFVKQDLAFAQPLGTVAIHSEGEAIPVFGATAKFRPTAGVNVLATFADGSPALLETNVGRGKITYFGFLPALAAFRPSVRREPVTRGGPDTALSHRCPVDLRPEIVSLLSGFKNEVPLAVEAVPGHVETCLVSSNSGVSLILVNWSVDPTDALVTVRCGVPRNEIRRCDGGPLSVTEQADGSLQLRLPVKTATAVIFR